MTTNKKNKNSRTTNLVKINENLYLRMPPCLILEKNIKLSDDFIALKVVGDDNLAFRRINPTLTNQDNEGLKGDDD